MAIQKEKNGKVYEKVHIEDHEIDEYCKTMVLDDETSCGFWFIRGKWMQSLANKKVLIILFGITQCFYGATFSYFNSTITTMEKRFKIPTRTMGFVSTGNDITKLLLSIILNYYASKGHKPRWMACGLFCAVLFCFMNAIPHLVYGPGDDALDVTYEKGGNYQSNITEEQLVNDQLCSKKDSAECNLKNESMFPVICWFIAQLISGIGGIILYSLGFSYLDDNIKKSKSPILISFTMFMRLLAPAFGYQLGSYCLSLFIDPNLTPTITPKDPRWLGAWWLGWIIMGLVLFIIGIFMLLLPKTLPRIAARKELIRQRSNVSGNQEESLSLKGLKVSILRLAKNRVFVLNQISTILFILGYLPFWSYLPKYIEIMYKTSASSASFYTGTVGFGFTALGLLFAGIVVQKYKPSSKYMAFWNALNDIIVAAGVIAYFFLGCPEADHVGLTNNLDGFNSSVSCSDNCMCDFVRFSPVCSMDNTQAFISACHAGCTQTAEADNGAKIYTNCSCVTSTRSDGSIEFGSVKSGPCPTNCNKQFYAFIGILSFLKFVMAMARLTNFLVAIRCVEERDKSLSLGVGLGTMSLFALIPAPIFYGYIIDTACLIWGKTCSGTGNCWLLNPLTMRYRLIFICFGFMSLCAVVDLCLWWIIGDLKVFDDIKIEENETVDDEKDDKCIKNNK